MRIVWHKKHISNRNFLQLSSKKKEAGQEYNLCTIKDKTNENINIKHNPASFMNSFIGSEKLWWRWWDSCLHRDIVILKNNRQMSWNIKSIAKKMI